MALRDWSTTAASNNAAAPNGAPEGWAPSAVNNTLREVMAQVRGFAETAEWFDYGDATTSSRKSGTVISLTGTHTATYAIGRRLQFRNQPGTSTYGTITDQTLTAGNTQVTVLPDSGSFTGTASAVLLGVITPGTATTSFPITALISDGVSIGDDQFLTFGAGSDCTIEYDEDGTDTTRLVAANGLTLAPHGTSSGNTTEVRWLELAANGTNYAGLKAPDSVTGTSVYTFPAAFPGSSQMLQSTTAGVLSWEDAGGAALTGSTNNTVVTVTGADAMQGEANLTFDGSQLAAPDGSAGAPSVTNTGDLNTGIYFPAADQLGVVVGGTEKVRFGSNPFTGRNLIINGDMKINQRGNQTGITDDTYTLDRWRWTDDGTTSVVVDITRSTEVPTSAEAGTAFAHSLRIDVTTAESLGSDEQVLLAQRIEAQDVTHIGHASAGALTTNLSFWIRSTITGVMCVNLRIADAGRRYIREVTIAASNTWEFVSVTYPGDTGGSAVVDDTGTGFLVEFNMAMGSSHDGGTADTWASDSSLNRTTSNQVNLLSSSSNDIYITGVQLEVGEVATAFEHRSAGEELTRCKRYFEYWNFNGTNDDTITCNLCVTTTAYAVVILEYVEKRATPTFTFTAAGTFDISTHNTDKNVISIGSPLQMGNRSTNAEGFDINLATVVAGDAGRFKRDSTDTCNITIDAEL